AHPAYATCGGQSVAFWIDGSAPTGDDRVFSQDVEWKCVWDAPSPGEETALDRLRNPVLGGPTIYHHVRRTAELQRLFRTLRELNVEDGFLHEQLINGLTAISGKNEILRSFFIARQWNTAVNGAQTE